MRHRNTFFVECTNYGNREKILDFFRVSIGHRYYPPWEKPWWYDSCTSNSPLIAVSRINKTAGIDISFDQIKASFHNTK